MNNYFIRKYFLPDLPIILYKYLIKIANSSIDISDGLFADLNKLINNQKIGYTVYLDKIPISKYLKSYLKKNNKKSLNFISKGDDYQILFTSSKKNRIYIKKLSKRINLKITKIGNTTNIYKQRKIINHKKHLKSLNYQGYLHRF